MAEPSSLDDLIQHRYAITPRPEELALLPDGGKRPPEAYHQRDLLKARLAHWLQTGGLDVLPTSRRAASWWLSLLGEMVWECRSAGWWGGTATLALLTAARDRLAAQLSGRVLTAAEAPR
jgi:hypothetical protein